MFQIFFKAGESVEKILYRYDHILYTYMEQGLGIRSDHPQYLGRVVALPIQIVKELWVALNTIFFPNHTTQSR